MKHLCPKHILYHHLNSSRRDFGEDICENVLDLFVLKIERIFEELYINAAQTFAEIDCLYEQLDNFLNVEEIW